MEIKKNKTIDDYLKQLAREQQENGSFLDSKGSKSILYTALILSCLNNLKRIEEIEGIKEKAVNFLLSQKDHSWLFSDNVGINFCVLSALMEYNSEIIDGRAVAKILMTLTSIEAKEGGPYYSYIVKGGKNLDKNIDLAVNTNIAYFLSLQNVDLPELDKLIESAVDSGDFKSSFYPSFYPIIYFISKFYKGEKKQKLIDFILEKRGETKKWDNPLYTALAISSLINLNYPHEKLQGEIDYFKKCETEELSKPYPFCAVCTSSPALNTAFYLEALGNIDKKDEQVKTDEGKSKGVVFDEDEKRMIDMILNVAKQRFSALNGEIKNFAMQEIQKTIKGDVNKHMSLVAYYLKKALGKKGERISDDMVARMNLTNLFFWTAFIIYDNFWDEDEDADPRVLPTANLYTRNFTRVFNSILSPKTGFNQFFRKLMDKLDAANTWETVYCRTKVEGSKFTIPEILPNHGNYERKYEPSSGHILGPVAMLVHLGYDLNSPEVQNLTQYFRNYLIAIQINDDAHDWEEDLRRGHLSTVVVMLLQDYLEKYPDKKEIDIDKALSELQRIFWFKTIINASETAVRHTNKSREALKAVTILEDLTPLEKIIITTENAAKKALKEQKATTDFLKTYKENVI